MPFLLIMPSYNQSHYIGSAIESILAQADADWELWIVDNSTDDTPNVVARYKDPRIKFHHIPQRMDPGTCLNWALERTSQRDFSYVHTDNNLAPDYVKLMRAALAQDDMALAYCNVRVIDDDGHYTGVYRRGEYDLAKLMSLSPLGVPFSATTALAKQVGGFSTRDVADDVLFSLLAYGQAKFAYIPDAPMDYRLHKGSRTSGFGGDAKMIEAFLQSYLRALPQLRDRGFDVLAALRDKMSIIQTGIELQVQDFWFRRGHQCGIELNALPSLQSMWDIGQFKLPDFSTPPMESLKPRATPHVRGGSLSMQQAARFKLIQRRLRKAISPELNQIRDYLIPWAAMSAGGTQTDIRCWLQSNDIYTVWASRQLQRMFGWTIMMTTEERASLPAWLDGIQTAQRPSQPSPQDIAMSLAPGRIRIERFLSF